MKMISCRGATRGASYSSLKGRLFPCASSTSRSPTRCRSLAVGMSLVTLTVPSNSSCSFCSTGVWLDGENGGVVSSGASIEVLGSIFRAVCESGGEGGVVVGIGGAEVAVGTGADLLSEVSMPNGVCGSRGGRRACVVVTQVTEASCAEARSRCKGRSLLEGGAALTIRRAESMKSCYFIDSARSAITE